jgi:hypothetical protein
VSDILPATLTISRNDLNLTPLNMNDPAHGYTLVRGGLTLGGRTWKRQTTTSPFTNARTMVARQVDVDTRDIRVRCKGYYDGGVQHTAHSLMHALADAFSQFSYTLTLDLNGTVYGWLCETADWTVGDSGAINEFMAMSFMYEMTFHVPVVRVLSGWM